MQTFGKLVRPFRSQQAVKRVPVSAQSAWVTRVEGFFFQIISLGFSGASAYAIFLVFTSHHVGDIGRLFEGSVVSVGFGVAGFFLSRNIAYRMMSGEMVWAYIPVCLVVEFVEIYCNYVVGVSELHLEDFLQGIPVDQHALLMLIGRFVVSSIPAMTLFLAVGDMDLQRRKVVEAQSKVPGALTSPYGVQSSVKSTLPPLPANSGGGARNQGPRPGQTAPATGAPTQRYQPVQPVKSNGRAPQNGVIIEDV